MHTTLMQASGDKGKNEFIPKSTLDGRTDPEAQFASYSLVSTWHA